MNRFIEYLRRERAILILCAAVFLVSAGYAFFFRIKPSVDAKAYDVIAVNITEGRGFRHTPATTLEKDDALTYQGPLYQFFLAGIYAAVGHKIWAVWLMHALMRAFSCFFIFQFCRRLSTEQGRRMGLASAAVFGFFPDLVESGAMLMTETLFMFLLTLTLYLFIRAFQKLTVPAVLGLTAAFGATFLTRSTVGAFLLFFWYWLIRERAWKHMLFAGLLFAAILTPWTVRNYKIYGIFIPTMANFGYNLVVGNRIGHDGEGGAPPELPLIFEKYGVIGANKYGIDYFKKFVRENSLEYARLTGLRAIKYFSFTRPMGFWPYFDGWKKAVFVASSSAAAFVVFSLGFTGLFISLRRDKQRILYYLAWFSAVTAAPVISILIETRYRMPIYPFMAIFSGIATAKLISSWKEYRGYAYWGFGLTLFIGLLTAVIEWRKIAEKWSALL